MAQVSAMLGMELRTSVCVFNYKYDINKVKSQRRGKGSRNRVKSKNVLVSSVNLPARALTMGVTHCQRGGSSVPWHSDSGSYGHTAPYMQ